MGWMAVVGLLFLLTAAFRFLALKNGFANDHFIYISAGRQMLFGEWPTRDFVDPGQPLMFAASALFQAWFGPTQLAEGILVSLAFGLGAALTALAVRQLTGSIALAVLAALFEIAVFPRTYSYPKVAAYALVVWLYGLYLSRPDPLRLFAMAAGVGLAFLFRHDHGLYLGVGAALTIVLAGKTWRAVLRDIAIFAVFLGALLLPYLLYVQVHGGLWTYFRTGIEFSQREAGRQWHIWPRVFGDDQPLLSAFVYELYALPLLALVILTSTWRHADWRERAARVAPIALVALLVDVVFIREPLNTRLADPIVPAVLLGAWILSRALARTSPRMLTAPLALACTVLMGASVFTVGSTYDEIDRADLRSDWQGIPDRLVVQAAALQSRFTDQELPTEATRRLIPFFGYLDRCTSAEDRLLIGGFMVEVPFYAQRLFAAGQGNFGGYPGSDASERFAFERLQRQRVPFALLPGGDDGKDFTGRFPLIAGYLGEWFAPLTDVIVNDEQAIHIFVNREIPYTAHDRETGWPCFRDPGAQAHEDWKSLSPWFHTPI